MPMQVWAHECACAPGDYDWSHCASCRRPGRHLGWRLTLVEQMEAFTNVTGFVMRVPDGEEASTILTRLVTCPLCDGDGIMQSDPPGKAWSWCPQCKGNGMSLDGEHERSRGRMEDGIGPILRLCAVGYAGWKRSARRDNGALDEDELAALRARLPEELPDAARLLPAVRTLDATVVAVGPTHETIVGQVWRSHVGRGAKVRVVRGYLELDQGHFLDSANAMLRARALRLVNSEESRLRPERLRYYLAIPACIARGGS